MKKECVNFEKESIYDRLRKYKPIDSATIEKIAISKGTQPAYIDLYKTMHKVECMFEALVDIAEKIDVLTSQENKTTNEKKA